MSFINIQPLLQAIAQDRLILTPNSRLKNKLIEAYNAHQIEHHHTLADSGIFHWPNIRVNSLQEWLIEQHQILLDNAYLDQPKALISGLQRQQLWQQIIEDNNAETELINPTRLTADADSAYTNAQKWLLDVNYLEQHIVTSLNERFVQWAESFREQLDILQLQTFEDLQLQVLKAYEQQLLPKIEQIIALGFGELPPITQRTFQTISYKIIEQSVSAPSTDRCSKISCNDREDEAAQVSAWAKHTLTANPKARIGIIVPNLGQDRALLEKHLLQHFEAHYLLPETNRYTLPFNFSTGIPLGSTPFIKDTLDLLKLLQQEHQCNTLINQIHSPFWGVTSNTADDSNSTTCDSALKATLIERIKQRGRATLSASQWRNLVHKIATSTTAEKTTAQTDTATKADQPSNYCQWLDSVLQTLITNLRSTPAKQLPSRWVTFFQQQLTLLNWPGERRLDSNEYQQAQQWLSFLEDVCRLDHLQVSLSCYEAIDQLGRSSNSTPFQAQTLESPIQVLGVLEGAGLVFSDCWIMGMTDKDWPPTAQPNPLLSIIMQREHAMPHADASRELAFAESLTESYQVCASDVIFSYATSDAQSPLHHSPLIEHISPFDTNDKQPPSTSALHKHIEALRQSSLLEEIDIGTAPPLSELEQKRVRGGSQILRNQAINPLAAFFIHRLNAKQPESITLGFTPQQRGHILHGALNSLWGDLKTHSQLLQLTDAVLELKVASFIDAEIASYKKREPKIFNPTYTDLEAKRQGSLIMQWLKQEKQRPAFTVIGRETPITTDIAGLTLSLRLDRLDQLESGEMIIIDYKTGSPNIKQWGSDKPEEPQLPLYALTYEPQVQALLFVQINAKDVCSKGIGELTQHHDGIIQSSKGGSYDLPEDWQSMLLHWQNTLQQLSLDFQNGVVNNEFKTPALARYYDYLNACLRTQEITQ
jgi:ATP-dependent helicase/nuclease subunit B